MQKMIENKQIKYWRLRERERELTQSTGERGGSAKLDGGSFCQSLFSDEESRGRDSQEAKQRSSRG